MKKVKTKKQILKKCESWNEHISGLKKEMKYMVVERWKEDIPAFSGASSRLRSIDGDCHVDNTGRTNEYKAGKHIALESPF